MRMVLGLAAPLAISAQVNLSGVWRWDRPANSANPNGASEMWKKIEQDGSRITVATRVVSAGGVESEVFTFIAGTAGNRNRMHGAPMTSSVQWDSGVLQVDSVARFGDEDLHMNDTYTLSGDSRHLIFRQRHKFGREPEGVDEAVFLRQPASSWPADEPTKPAKQVYQNIQTLTGLPAPELPSTMAAFAQSLGVSCTYCHVPGEFKNDDKEAKLTARKMIRTVNTLTTS